MTISVLIPSHNPRADYLDRTLAALRAQTLPVHAWELLLIDNASNPPISESLVSWHPHGRVISAPELGLTFARLAGFGAAKADLLVLADDDNILDPDYLESAVRFASLHPRVGAFGGKSIPEYSAPPPDWFARTGVSLGCRDFGDQEKLLVNPSETALTEYPQMAPIGAGMVLRRAVAEAYRRSLARRKGSVITDRCGARLSSAGDCDIVLCGLQAGWGTAYTPSLRLTHLIPPGRLTLDYLCRIARASYRDFVRVLAIHGIRPWPPITPLGVLPRQIKAWFIHRAWSDPAARVRWQGYCGQIEGRARTPICREKKRAIK